MADLPKSLEEWAIEIQFASALLEAPCTPTLGNV